MKTMLRWVTALLLAAAGPLAAQECFEIKSATGTAQPWELVDARSETVGTANSESTALRNAQALAEAGTYGDTIYYFGQYVVVYRCERGTPPTEPPPVEPPPETALPGQPGKPQFTEQVGDQVLVAWDPATDAMSYTYRWGQNAVPGDENSDDTLSTSVTLLLPDNSWFCVNGENIAGSGPENCNTYNASVVEPPPEPEPPPGNGDNPNEPGDFAPLFDTAFDADDWDTRKGEFSIVQDDSAPVSPPNVGQMLYKRGKGDGFSPGAVTKNIPKVRGLYVRYRVMISANFQGHPGSGTNKSLFLVDTSDGKASNPVFTDFHGRDMGALPMRVSRQGSVVENGPSNGTITRGVWHDIEVLIRMNTGSNSDGSIEAWLNGVKTHTMLNTRISNPAGSGFNVIKWDPTWGGRGYTLAQDQQMWIDHLYVSGK